MPGLAQSQDAMLGKETWFCFHGAYSLEGETSKGNTRINKAEWSQM